MGRGNLKDCPRDVVFKENFSYFFFFASFVDGTHDVCLNASRLWDDMHILSILFICDSNPFRFDVPWLLPN